MIGIVMFSLPGDNDVLNAVDERVLNLAIWLWNQVKWCMIERWKRMHGHRVCRMDY